MSKSITIDYDEYLDMQDLIKKLKEQNSALCQGASVVEAYEIDVNGMWINRVMSRPPRFIRKNETLLQGVAAREVEHSVDLIRASDAVVAKGAESSVYFRGVETLTLRLKRQIKTMNETLARLRNE